MGKQSVEILERIRLVYYELTEAERKIADYILNHADKVQFMSITELAQACCVADSTVFRFCRSLNLPGFTGFKLELAKSLAVVGGQQSKDCDDSILGRGKKTSLLVQQAMEETLRLADENAIKQAVTMMENAGKVLIMGSGGGAITAETFVHMFSGICDKCRSVREAHLQFMEVAAMSSQDVLIVLSHSGATKNGIDLLRHAREYGVQTILITHFPRSPAAEYADLVLRSGYDESPLEFGMLPSRVSGLLVMDMLFYEYYSRNREQCEEYRRRMIASISSQHV